MQDGKDRDKPSPAANISKFRRDRPILADFLDGAELPSGAACLGNESGHLVLHIDDPQIVAQPVGLQ